MKSKIYKKLTIENKILLSESALNYLSSHKITDLDHIINEYKKSTYPILTEDLVKQFILKKEDTILSSAFYQIINFEYKIKNFAENYEFLKNKINLKIVPILHLKEKQQSNIFGLFYSNFMNESILEDSFSEIKLDFSKCKSKIFLFDKMFLGCKGILVNKIFYVDEFFLPTYKSIFGKNDLLKQKDFIFLVFFDVKFSHKNVKILREIFIKNLPEAVFFLGNYDKSDECIEFIKENTHVLFFFVHTRDELPRKFQPICTEQNYKIMTNPCEIHFKNFKIGFVVSEIFKNKTKGIFLQKNYQESFISSFLSQYSYNPFVNLDFKIDTFPNLLFIGQSAFSGVFTCEDVNVVSVSSFEESFSYFKCDNFFNISLCEADE